MLAQIFSIVFPIFAIVLVGYLYGRRHLPDMAAANKLNLDIFTPALILSVLSGKSFELGEYQALALGGLIVVLGSGLLSWPVARMLGYQTKTFVPPMMFTNSGNMGLPLALFAFGENALPAAVVLFIVENFLHFSVGMKMMDRHAPLLSLARIPVLLATLAGLSISFFTISLPEVILLPIDMLGQVAIPLMLFSLGVRMLSVDLGAWRIGMVGALVCPLSGILLALGFHLVFPLPPEQLPLLLIFGALPPAVLNFMFAERYGQEPQNVASIVMLGNLASLLVIPLVLAFVL